MLFLSDIYLARACMSFWYPSWDFYLETHDRILEEFGGYPGIAFGGELVFSSAIQAVHELPGGLYDKAGLMLQLLRTNRIVEDAQKRTAYTVTATFLEINGGTISILDAQKASAFIKDILKYDLSDVTEWIKHGKIPERS